MTILHGDPISGSCQKVHWTADHLGIATEWRDVDLLKGETRTPEFLALNPDGRVPNLVLDDGRVLSESNAIIAYLARGSALVPGEPFTHAKMLQWMFWEQYSHEPYVACAASIWSISAALPTASIRACSNATMPRSR